MWLTQQPSLCVLPVAGAVPADRHAREQYIVDIIHVIIIEISTWKSWEKSIPKYREYIKHILVEHIENYIAIPSVSFSTMREHKILQESELPNRIISSSSGLHSLQATYADTNVSCIYHVDIVCTISYGQCCDFSWVFFVSYNADYLCFLLWRNSTRNYYLLIFRQINEFLQNLFLACNFGQLLATDYECCFSCVANLLLLRGKVT